MSIETLQQRLADLKFSVEETIKTFKREQDESEEAHADWEESLEGETDDHTDEPDVIDNDSKIDALENAKDKIDQAIDALDDALED